MDQIQTISDSVIRIEEKVRCIPEMQTDIKKLHTQYMEVQGTLRAYADIKEEIKEMKFEFSAKIKEIRDKNQKLTNKIYFFSGAAAVIGFIADKVVDKMF